MNVSIFKVDDSMKLENTNPYIRAAEIQPAVLEGNGPRKAYDHRLFYVLESSGSIVVEGTAHSLSPDSLVILPPAVEYYFIGKLRTLVLNFDLTRACADRPQPICPPPATEFEEALRFDRQVVDGLDAPLFDRGDGFSRQTLLRIVEEFASAGSCADALTSALLKGLLAELLRRGDAQEDTVCKKVMGYIRNNAAAISGNAEIARVFGYHPVYLGELFRRVTGKTLHEAVMEEKIALGCRWLTRTDSPVAEIAESCGFCSRTHFCTVFKKKLGVSPTEYRRIH